MEHLQCSTSERSEAIKEFGAKGSDHERERASERARERERESPSRNLAVKAERASERARSRESESEREEEERDYQLIQRQRGHVIPPRMSNFKNKSTFHRNRRQTYHCVSSYYSVCSYY